MWKEGGTRIGEVQLVDKIMMIVRVPANKEGVKELNSRVMKGRVSSLYDVCGVGWGGG